MYSKYMNFLLPTFLTISFQFQQLRFTFLLFSSQVINTEPYFTISPLNHIADQSITCLINHFHSGICFRSLIFPLGIQNTTTQTSFFTSNYGNFRQVQMPRNSEKIKFALKEESHEISFVLTENLTPKQKVWQSLKRADSCQTS